MTSTPTSPRLTLGIAGPASLQDLAERVPDYTPKTSGLSSPIITSLARELRRRGHEVHVFTLSSDPHDWGDAHADGLHVHVRRYRRRGRWVDRFRAERAALTAAMRAQPCDLIHAHWTYEFALAAMRSGRPHLVTVHDWGPEILRHHRHPYRVVRLGMQAQVLRKAPHLTANSPYTAEKVARWFRREIPVIPNGIAVPANLPERIDGDGLVLGAMNNGFGVLKNLTALIQAFAQVRRRRPDAVLRLAGIGFEPQGPAQRWTRERGLDGDIEYLGQLPVTDVPGFMRSLDIFVHPSLEESFGSVLIEAISEGTPVIGGVRSGAVPWVLGHGTAGRLVDVTSPEALSKAILDLADDQEARSLLANVAFEHVRANFSLDHVVDLYEAEYRRVLAVR